MCELELKLIMIIFIARKVKIVLITIIIQRFLTIWITIATSSFIKLNKLKFLLTQHFFTIIKKKNLTNK